MHLVVAITVGLVVAMLAITGMMMAFDRQLIAWVEGGDGRPAQTNSSARSVEQLLSDAMRQVQGENPTMITLSADPQAPAGVMFGPYHWVAINTYSGAITGHDANGMRRFFRTIEEIHRWLAMPVEWRPIGRGITGVAGLAFSFLALSGLFLWFPRRRSWTAIKVVTVPDVRLKGKLRNWNWHNALGFWALIPILLITTTGTVMGYRWANQLLFAAVGDTLPPAPPPKKPTTQPKVVANPQPKPLMKLDALDAAYATAMQHVKTYQKVTLRWTDKPNEVQVAVSQNDDPFSYDRTTIFIDRQTAALKRIETFADVPPGRRARSMMLPIHSGSILGIVGQIIAFCVCIIVLVLIYTGFALALRRLTPKRRKQQPALVQG